MMRALKNRASKETHKKVGVIYLEAEKADEGHSQHHQLHREQCREKPECSPNAMGGKKWEKRQHCIPADSGWTSGWQHEELPELMPVSSPHLRNVFHYLPRCNTIWGKSNTERQRRYSQRDATSWKEKMKKVVENGEDKCKASLRKRKKWWTLYPMSQTTEGRNRRVFIHRRNTAVSWDDELSKNHQTHLLSCLKVFPGH